jgi:hypothetical protein
MSDAEVHVLWARLRPSTPEGQRAAEADLAAARALGAGDADADLALTDAAWRAEAKEYGDAESTLRDALAAHGDDPRLWHALGVVALREHVDGAGRLSPAGGEELARVAARLEPIAKSAAEFDLLAKVSAIRGQPDAGLAYEKRALAANASCVACIASLASLLYEKGRVSEALDAATLAMGLVPEGTSTRALAQLAAECKRKLAAGEGATAQDACASDAQVQQVIRSHVIAVRRTCWENARTKPAKAKVSVVLTVGPDGKPQAVSVESEAPSVTKCVESDVHTWRFPVTGCTHKADFSLVFGGP